MNFRFTLSNPTLGTEVLSKTPVGWDGTELALKRSETFKGLFFDFTTQLKFFCGGGGKEYIDNAYDTLGVECNVSVLVEIDCNDSGLFDTLFIGTVNFSTYQKTQTSPEYSIVNIENAGIEQLLTNRYETTINLNKLTTIDGTALTPFNFGDDNYLLNMHSKEIDYNSLTVYDATLLEPKPNPRFTNTSGHAITINLYANLNLNNIKYDDIGGTQVPFGKAKTSINPDGFTFDPIFSSAIDSDYQVYVQYTGSIGGEVTNPTPGTFDLYLSYSIGDLGFPGPLAPTHLVTIGTGLVSPGVPNGFTVPISINQQFTIHIPAGKFLYLYISAENFVVNTSQDISAELFTTGGAIKLSLKSTTAATTCNAFGIFEAGARLAQSITNKTDAFRSDFFGRTNAQPYASAQNGCGSFMALTNGYQIRGFPLHNSGSAPLVQLGRPIYTSLKYFFESLDAIYNLGIGVDFDGTNYYMRMEPIEYFYSTEVIYQIPNIKNYTLKNANDFYINDFVIGYQKWATNAINGIDEFNTQREYTVKLKKNGNKVTKVSQYVAGAYAIELTRRKLYKFASTEDTEFDEENFLICLNRSVNPYTNIPSALNTAEKDENFPGTQNVISPSTMYNLRISPGRIVRNWFKTIGTGIIKMNDVLKNVIFAVGQGNYNMISQVTAGSDPCDSAAGQPVNELSDLNIVIPSSSTKLDPLFEPVFIQFETPMSYSQYKLIKENPTKCLEISPYSDNFIKAFVYDIRYSPVKGTAKFILLKAYDQGGNDCTHLYVEAGYVECGYVE